jgi:hypothetical protein
MHPFGPKQIGSDYCPDGKFGPELKPDMVVELDNIDYIVKIITSINFEMFPKDFIKIIQSLQKRSDIQYPGRSPKYKIIVYLKKI